MKIFYKFIVLIFLFSVTFISAQISDFSNVDVDKMPDEKIEKFWNSLKKEGYTMLQAEKILKSKGVSQLQIDKLKKRIEKLLAKKNKIKGNNVRKKDTTISKFDKILFGLTGKEKKQNKRKDSLYGYDFFNNPKIIFTPNINVATPDNYQIGSGDVIQINIWGAAEAKYEKKVNKQGNIHINGVGRVNLVGLNFNEVKSKIKSRLKTIYSGISESSSSYRKVFVGINLLEVKTVQVNIVGEVKAPSTYSLSGLSTVLNGLYAAGGPTKQGNFRKISLIRGGSKIADFDFYNYIQNGNEKGNLQLKDQDVIIVGAYENLVTIKGEVKRPGYYQMKPDESIEKIFKYCGGFTANAYKNNITIERVKGVGREVVEFDFKDARAKKSFNGDVVTVKKISNIFDNKVFIEGAVNVEGVYQITKKMTVKDLVKKASGVKENAFIKRGLIKRHRNGTYNKVVSFSLEEGADNVYVMPNDKVHVYSIEDLKEKPKLTINGAVNKPLKIDYSYGITVGDLVVLAGGFKSGADSSNIEISRRKKDGSFEVLGEVYSFSASNDLELTSKNKFELQPYDIISVRYLKGYSVQKKVVIKGEVKAPGEYIITSKNERISDLVKRAGGLSPYAYVEGATLIRKKQGEEDAKQLEFLEELQKKDSVLSKVKVKEKKDFRIGINLKSIINNKHGQQDLILEEGDELIVPTMKQTVEVRGEVYSPSLVQYIPGKSLRYYVDNAGGFTHLAKKNRTYVVYANGGVDATNNFLFFRNFPEVKPGATILVPKKVEKRKITTQELIGITTGMATLGVLIDKLVSK